MREAEREQAREAREQQQASQNWEKWSDDRADARIYAAVQKDELLCDVIGDALNRFHHSG
jgi:hypothetical protein